MTHQDVTDTVHKAPLPQPLKIEVAATLVVALLVALLGLAGLLAQDTIYPSAELRRTFVPNDLVNLLVGLPLLLGALWLARRGQLLGLLCWPGALFFVTYNAIAYVYALPPGWPFLLNVTLLALTLYSLIAVVARIDGASVQRRLAGHAPVRLASGVLIGLGVLFLLRSAGVIATAGASLPRTELAVLVADFLTTPAWIIGGALLWRRQQLGYVGSVGLLFQASMLFVALIVFLLAQPIVTDAPFAPVDVLVVFGMGLFCFVPFGLFVRSILVASTVEVE
ncbi:MAG: hypothetical protein R6W76_15915 [Caldilinea sp.]